MRGSISDEQSRNSSPRNSANNDEISMKLLGQFRNDIARIALLAEMLNIIAALLVQDAVTSHS